MELNFPQKERVNFEKIRWRLGLGRSTPGYMCSEWTLKPYRYIIKIYNITAGNIRRLHTEGRKKRNLKFNSRANGEI